MTVNISSRNSTITIDGVDYTDQLISVTGSDTHIEGSGLVTFQGTLTLAPLVNVELDDWITDAFETGLPIIILTENEAGTLTRNPRGALRVIRPAFDEVTKQQSLRVGDLISLLRYRAPTDDEAIAVDSVSGTTVRNVVDQLLTLSGIGTRVWNTTIADNYVFRCPIELKQSYLNTADDILYSFGLYGWIDGFEQFVIEEIEPDTTPSLFEIFQGSTEAGNLVRLNNKPIPPEIVRGFGTYRKVTQRPASVSRLLAQDFGLVDDLIPGPQAGFGILRQELEDERYFPLNPIQLEIDRYLYLLRYWVYQGYPGFPNIGISRAQADLERYTYETTGSKRLRQLFRDTIKPTVLAISDFVKWAFDNNTPVFDNLILGQQIIAGRQLDVYTYNAEEQLIMLEQTTWETISDIIGLLNLDWQIVYDSVGIPTDIRQSLIVRTEWRREEEGWLRYQTRAIAKARDTRYRQALPERLEAGEVAPEDVVAEATTTIITQTGTRDQSNSGVVNPPATEHIPRPFIDTTCTIEAIANFPQFNSTFRERERAIQIPYLPDTVSDPANVQTIANRFVQIQGAILKGQYRGMRVPMPLREEFFASYKPFLVFDLQKSDLTRFRLAMDGTTWTLTPTQILVSTDAIYIARLVDGQPVPPYQPSMRLIGGMLLGGTLDTTPIPNPLIGGFLLGAVFIEQAQLILCWDTLTPEEFDLLSPMQWDVINVACREAEFICFDDIPAEIFDQIRPDQWDRLAELDCIYVLVICWDDITEVQADSISDLEWDTLAIYDCSYL